MRFLHRLIIVTTAAVSMVTVCPIPCAGDDDSDASQVIADARSPLTLVEETAKAERDKRTRQYVQDLKALEDTVAEKTGDLDLILIVRDERLAWQEGEPTPEIDPKDENYPLELRKLRYYFDQDQKKFTANSRAAREKAMTTVIAALKQAESALTRAKKIEDALAVRKEREILEKELANARNPRPDGTSRPSLLTGDDEDVLRVTPNGSANSITLDEALQQAKPGNTLMLERGTYPNSKVFPPVDGVNHYPVSVPKLRLIGDHSTIPGTLAVLANDIEISGITCVTLQIGGSLKDETAENVSVNGCLYRVISIKGGSDAAVHNSLGGLYLDVGSTATFEHCTLAFWITSSSPHRYLIHGFRPNSESRFEKCIVKGGTYLCAVFSGGPAEALLIDCIVHADQFYAHHSPGGDNVEKIADPDELKRFGFQMRNVRFEDPLFLDPERNDFRIKRDSPAKGQGLNQTDLGAHLGADGWPVPLDTR